jgi:hypothetical protein
VQALEEHGAGVQEVARKEIKEIEEADEYDRPG